MRSHGILTLLVCIVAVLAVAGAGCTGTTQAGGDELKDSYIVGIDGSYGTVQLC